MSATLRCLSRALLPVLVFVGLLLPRTAHAAFINFDNCLDTNVVHSKPLQLQWIPLAVDAKFQREPPYNLTLTIYGNVSGQQVVGNYPPPTSPDWQNPNMTFGKISNIGSSGSGNYSTLLADFKVLQYSAYNAKASEFCGSLVNASCPLGPYFDANDTNPYTLPAFTVSHDFGSGYSFSTLAGQISVLSGDNGAPQLACISTNITPDLGSGVTSLITWLPAAILIIKGIATLAAAIWSPWGSSDIFRWSSNYGRDEDQLRLVTPGFGDCLQYIQFVTLTGALSLQYPGFYQPAVSQTSWSLLLFNQSYVSGGNGTQSLVDGVYKYNGTYGMTAMSQLIGQSSVEDIWACMAIWLLVIAGIVLLLCQLGFLARWIYRTVTDTTEEDLRQKNFPFTFGNMIRLVFNYFILPIVALSLFQLVISPGSPTSVIVCAVIMLVLVVVVAGWIIRVILTTKPRTYLFDDMPTVLMYGPLYNTYSDSAAPFALVPVFITFMRAVALGAVQPSGIAQIIMLAICEVILILTLNGFRPFQNETSMNAYHTSFSAIRLVTVLMSIAFVPSLNVAESPKGWIGYAILLLHAFVLVFGFFLNALQTLIEVIARSTGVASDSQTGAIRGSIMNLRMLRKRQNRPETGDRASMTSHAAILQDADARSNYAGGRSRSMSASSQQLLNQGGRASSMNRLSGFENFSNAGEPPQMTPSTDMDHAQSPFTFVPGGAGYVNKADAVSKKETEQNFYRPPRPRRTTLEQLGTPGAKTRKSGRSSGSGSDTYKDSPDPRSEDPSSHVRSGSYEVGSFVPGRDSPAPAYIRDRADSNENLPRPDYAVREVDQYYRGAALSDLPTRKLKTGPADPEGPAANAQTWLQKLVFGVKNKQKEPTKGFEVVRSSRAPPGMRDLEDGMEMQTSPPMRQDEPYLDSPPLRQGDLRQASGGAERAASPVQDEQSPPIGQRGFNFGLDGVASVPGRQDSGRANAVQLPHNAGNILHPGLRAEQPSLRSRPSADTISNYDRPRPSGDDVSDYDRPRPSADTGSDYDQRHSASIAGDREPYHLSIAPSLGPIESVGGLDLPSRFNSRRSQNLENIDIGNTQGGQDWLKAVDELQWNHGGTALPASSHQPTASASASQRQPPAPRQFSTDSTDNPYENDDMFSGFDSGLSEPGPDFLSAPRTQEVRPGSFASVNHHRAADSISRNSFGANAALQGSSAEIFGATPPRGDGFGGGR
ncbi:hypothetical protein LTR78_003435 [Recurvomyces mirabilis]|uniref:ML-like domain-containing protein n=1 Tax=Recurvomyces mirabilis TaxID=574656 RepID=A0AAE0WRF6_9PEZI|nr:hypothetical protein LTR78_003435 [Recurvomyces mirabilis]KAK5154531.1 hypothetical protein LTS14_006668 [Recurvomyces mirabilis]